MKHKKLIGAVLVATIGGALLLWALRDTSRAPVAEVATPDVPPAALLPSICKEIVREDVAYIVCTVDPKAHEISLQLNGGDGKPMGSLAKLAETQTFVFAMNAGMYHDDLSPVGLYIEGGKEIRPVNLAQETGNFFLKPNGVFFVTEDGMAGVLETGAIGPFQQHFRFATQSGPMLVIDGNIHPRFEADGASRHVRNGVGVDRAGLAIFAISREPVSFGKFARLFRDGLNCPNALFLDGTISALHDGKGYLAGGKYPAGPVVVVRQKTPETQ